MFPQCKLEVFADEGTTGNNARYINCLRDLTESRIKQLETAPTDTASEKKFASSGCISFAGGSRALDPMDTKKRQSKNTQYLHLG